MSVLGGASSVTRLGSEWKSYKSQNFQNANGHESECWNFGSYSVAGGHRGDTRFRIIWNTFSATNAWGGMTTQKVPAVQYLAALGRS